MACFSVSTGTSLVKFVQWRLFFMLANYWLPLFFILCYTIVVCVEQILRNLPSWQSFFTPLTQNRISGYFESYSSAHFLSPRTVPPPSSSLAVRCLEKNNLKVTTHMVAGFLQTLPKIIIIMDRSSLKQQNATIVASSVNVRSPACTRYSWWCK